MKIKALAILAAVLAVLAIGAWLWSGMQGPDTPLSKEAGVPAEQDRAEALPGPRKPAPSVASAPSTTEGGQDLPSKPAVRAAPVRMTSSVTPGQPMVRSTPAPPLPAVAAPPAKAPGIASQPVREIEGKAEVEKVQTMLRDFRTRMGENPVGSNAEIMRAVMGGNPAKARLGPPEGQGINEQGELIDQWGMPYFFHQLAKDSMEVRSAGPDRVMWTPDDLVTK